jgi:protein ImuB
MVLNSNKPPGKEVDGLWLCLHFKQLPVEIFSRSQTDKPVVVTNKQRIQYMNTAAEKIGIRIGSSMDTAYTLSSQVVSFERDEEKEFSVLSHLAQWAYQFTPAVSIKTPHSLVLDIRGCLKLFGGITNIKSKISTGLFKLGYTACIGVNTTPLAALFMAESVMAESVIAESGITENVRSGHGFTKENEDSSDIIKSLQTIPISYLRTDKKVIESLRQMGIQDVGALLKLPLDGLNRRFGIFFTDYLLRLIGEKPDPQKFISEIPRFFSDITFLSDVTNIQSLAFPVKRLLQELCDFLQTRQLHINQFTFKLSHRSHSAKSFSIYLANPENDAGMFLMLTQLQLDKINDMPEVDNLRLIANTFCPADSVSGDLFHNAPVSNKGGKSKMDQDRTNQLLNMFRARLGPQTCFGLSMANDHRPEKAWKTVRLNQKDYWFPKNEKAENPRPLYLLNAIQELRTRNDRPLLGSQLELTRGPERIDFGWWDGDDSARDYYIARHPSGALYWVFNHLNTSKWFLHGIFS